MDRFLLKRKSANEAEVEEVHVEENLAAPTTKRNNFNPEPAIELWMDDAKKPRRLVDAYGHQRPKQAEIK